MAVSGFPPNSARPRQPCDSLIKAGLLERGENLEIRLVAESLFAHFLLSRGSEKRG